MITRVLLADDHPPVRQGLRQALAGAGDLTVAGEAYDGRMAVDLASMLMPDVVLMSVHMPVLDGIGATQEISAAHARVRVVVLVGSEPDGPVLDALRAGASGFLAKDAAAEDVVAAVRLVARGDSLLAPALTRRVVEEFARTPANPRIHPPEVLRHLTGREREVLDLLARGLSNAEIRQTLLISEATTKSHVTRVLTKLGLRERTQVMIWAWEAGLLSTGR